LKYFLLKTQTQDQFVTSYLRNEDDAEFLKAKSSAKWQRLLGNFQNDAEEFERQADAAGVPFAAVLVPNRAQAAMLSMGDWPEGYDPYKLDNELRTIIVSHGGTYLDILPALSRLPDTEQDYFSLDGHPNSEGHAMISRLLSKELANSLLPALTARAQAQTSSVRKR
jgi:hypothetical protein